MKNWDPKNIREQIKLFLPPGLVVPRHNATGHFYEIEKSVYPSVTGKLQILKDEGLINYKMNRAIEYFRSFIYGNYSKLGQLKDHLVMDEIEKACSQASRITQDILMDAGDVGTRIHNIRQAIFEKWMEESERPADFLAFIPPEEVDVRVTSAIRALQKFCIERDYIPVACELLVYSHELKVAGTLDDLGLVREILKKGDPDCVHKDLMHDIRGKKTCLSCGYQLSRHRFCLMDIKTSNQFKDHYFFQVALYASMFYKLVRLKPELCFIAKLSKEDGSYKIEDLKKPYVLAKYARHMVKTNEGVEFIRSLRKDNQRTVVPL